MVVVVLTVCINDVSVDIAEQMHLNLGERGGRRGISLCTRP